MLFFFFLSPHLPHPSHHPFILKWDHVYVCLWFLFVLSRPLQYCDFLEILFPVCDYSLCPHTQLHLYPFLAFLSRQVFWFILSSDIATGFLALVLLFSHSLSFPPFFLRLTPSLLWLLGIILGLKIRRLQAWANNKNLWRQGIIQWGGGLESYLRENIQILFLKNVLLAEKGKFSECIRPTNVSL